MIPADLRIAAIVPCHNEETAVGAVVRDLRAAIPGVDVYVYDNASTDRTSEVAAEAGAIVRHEPRKGKGNVVRRAFADVDADVYLMIDGDDTYEAAAAPEMIDLLLRENLDHVLGCRVDDQENSAYRPGHAQGNRAFNALVGWLFGEPVTDMLSGYRIFSKRFVKSFPALSRHFEIETELTVHSMALRVPQREYPVGFKDRPEGSESKLNTVRDGMRILGLIARLLAHERPLAFYGSLAMILFALALAFGAPVVWEFAHTGLVPRLPSAVLASSLVILGAMSGVVGMIQSGILKARQEATRLAYLQLPSTPRG
ncbi:glycosyltransferase [Schaalia sp. 19OD2882]|uniref:glycosyltransferase n=1 Tax=Schaalia sp. 19OD2882 TaxID=2794089 RepID=UPI001C1EC7AF|nr:glycosyltransferase [Schaalia sp. 19OD2882]QWW20291.1 glycosyltransferase [Schaalia sp. 19OD2882]